MPNRSPRLPAPLLLFLGDASSTAAGMKIRASAFIKQVVAAVIAMAKTKSAALRSKTSAVKARLLVFTLLRNKKVLMTAFAQKVHALTHGAKDAAAGRSLSDVGCADHETRTIVLYHNGASVTASPVAGTSAAEPFSLGYAAYDDYSSGDEDEYPDLSHSLFDLEEEEEDDEIPVGSVIEMAKTSKEEGGEQFNLEDEIDHVADMFIQRFHKHIRIEQKKRYKEMLQGGN